MNDYARKHNILKESDKNLSGDDVREGLTAIISVKLKDAQFEGQTKAKLGNTEVRSLVRRHCLLTSSATYLEENPAAARTISGQGASAQPGPGKPPGVPGNWPGAKSALETASLPGKLADCSEPGH